MMRTLDQDKCTANDCRRLFVEAAEPLDWLCYTLTGDEALSRKVLDAALEQSLKDAGQVFREWMMSWARRVIIRVCIEMVRPRNANLAQESYQLLPVSLDSADLNSLNLPSELLQQRLLQLDALSRFVFVLRAIEGYSRRDTSLLLNIDDRACEWLYVRAGRTLADDAETIDTQWNRAWGSHLSCSPVLAGN